ncbi:MAG: Nudix family hydrolase [Pseudohongiellaceae bacterium]
MLSAEKVVHVAVGVVRSRDGRVLVSLRHPDAHQGGLWEFPGGKVEPGETVKAALCREFSEELGIFPTVCFPLKKIAHSYGDRKVLLDVWMIQAYQGEPQGLEGQQIDWQKVESLQFDQFPAANKPIIDALKLPLELPITPELASLDNLNELLSSWVTRGWEVVFLQQNSMSDSNYVKWLAHAHERFAGQGLKFIADFSKCKQPQAQAAYGFHVSSQELLALEQRPVPADIRFSASCHNLQELKKAESLGADFVFLAPTHPLTKHSNSKPLPWAGFSSLVEQVSLPVYALEEVGPEDIECAIAHGAVGISGVSAFSS